MQFLLVKKCTLSLFIAFLIASGPAFADKPDWNDNRNMDNPLDWQKKKNRQHNDRIEMDREREQRSAGIRFNNHHREIIHQYYSDSFRADQCPPGLAKKHNGCMPPGQAKRWHIGRPLPRDVEYYDLPPQIIISLGAPPAGYKYVRVASDILMIAVGSGMVVDAIQDLNHL